MSDKNKTRVIQMQNADVSEIHTKEYEKCIICGETTNIPVDMPINLRSHYVIGCGQLCAKCSDKLRRRTIKEFKKIYKI